MTMRWASTLALAAWLAVPAHADRASVTLDDGTKVSFELVRSMGATGTKQASGVSSGEGEGYRLLLDTKQGRFHAYAVRATRLPGRRFRVEVGPVSADTAARLTKRVAGIHPGQGARVESLAIEYPPAREVADGEPLLLELMVNPATGETLSDIIRVSGSSEEARAAGSLHVSRGIVRINGERLRESGGGRGPQLYFAPPGRGRFLVSLRPVAGYDFVPAKLVDNRVVEFAVAGDSYQWESAEPIVTAGPIPEQLWVWHDTSFQLKPGRTFEVGVLDLSDRISPTP